MAIIGLEKMYIAKLKNDNGVLEYDTPKRYESIREITTSPKVNTSKLYAENEIYHQNTTLDGVEVTVDIASLTIEERAELLGHKISSEGVLIQKSTDVAPFVALLYKSNKHDGDRYQVLYKGKFELSEEKAKGKEGNANYQTDQMKALFIPTRTNKMWKSTIHSDSSSCPVDIETRFFESVFIPKESPLAPILDYTIAKGTTSGSTKITASTGVGNTLATKVQATFIGNVHVGNEATGTTAYTSGTEITGVKAGNHVGLFELDKDGKVVKFIDITLISTNIAV